MIYKDKDAFSKTKMHFQRQRRPKDVPKTEALREDIKDANPKDKDAKDKLDVFLMTEARHIVWILGTFQRLRISPIAQRRNEPGRPLAFVHVW
jgi:hypothetical protein